MFPGLWCFHVYAGVIQANYSKLPLESELNADEATLCINRLLKGFSGARRRLREVSWWANQLRWQSSNCTLHSKSSWKETQLLAPPVCPDPWPDPCLRPVHASCPASSCSPARGSPRPSSPPTPRTCGSCDEAFHRPPARSSPPNTFCN